MPLPIRGGKTRTNPVAFMPWMRMGLPPRSFAADAHGCIMVRSWRPTEYKAAARSIAPERELPSDRPRRTAPAWLLARRPSRPLRAACGGGLRPVLTGTSPTTLTGGRSGRRNGPRRTKKQTSIPMPKDPLTPEAPYKGVRCRGAKPLTDRNTGRSKKIVLIFQFCNPSSVALRVPPSPIGRRKSPLPLRCVKALARGEGTLHCLNGSRPRASAPRASWRW